MDDQQEAQFVVVGSRGQGVAMGYLTALGAFGDIRSATTFSFEDAMIKAREIAEQEPSSQSPSVAPLLFGIPDMEQAITPSRKPA